MIQAVPAAEPQTFIGGGHLAGHSACIGHLSWHPTARTYKALQHDAQLVSRKRLMEQWRTFI
jgi:hypothetical protein